MRLLQIVLLLAPLTWAVRLDRRGRVSYDGYKVFRVETADHGVEAVVAEFGAIEATELTHTHNHVDVAVPPESIPAFLALNFASSVLTEDLGAEIALEGELVAYPGRESQEVTIMDVGVGVTALPSNSWFNAYHAYADHLTWLSDVQSAFPNNSELIQSGTSFEDRPIQGIHLWGAGGKASKPAILWHGNVHAREWITSMTVEYLTYQLVVGYGNDTTVQAILDSYDFYIFPVVNPDGFVFSQQSTRLWRKNRQTRSGTRAIGTDINRNWPYKWELSGGASTTPTAEDYKGQVAGDTPENLGLRNYAAKLAANGVIKFYCDWHSYSQLLLLPYGYDCSARVDNLNEQTSLARSVVQKIREPYGTVFEYGPSCSTIYKTTGSSDDYLTDVHDVDYSWTFELRPSDSASNGFVLPAAQIRPVGVEMWAGVKYMLQAF